MNILKWNKIREQIEQEENIQKMVECLKKLVKEDLINEELEEVNFLVEKLVHKMTDEQIKETYFILKEEINWK